MMALSSGSGLNKNLKDKTVELLETIIKNKKIGTPYLYFYPIKQNKTIRFE